MASQNTDLQHEKTPSALRWARPILGKVCACIALIAALVTIVVYIQQLDSKPHITLTVLDNQCLTRVSSIPELECKYGFKGREVRSLWVSKIRLINDCSKNIIGLPGHDLMGSNIVFNISGGFNVISAEFDSNDFAGKLCTDDVSLAVSFAKWRPNESCIIKVYCEGPKELGDNVMPKYSEAFDPLTQGEVDVSEFSVEKPRISVLCYMPYWAYITVSILGILAYAALLGVCLFSFFLSWKESIVRLRWERRYLKQVEAEIVKRKTKNESGGDPDYMPEAFWKEIGLPKPPKKDMFVRRGKINWSEAVLFSALVLLVASLSAVSLASLIYI